MKFSELRFTKYLRHQPIMHSQWLKDKHGNSWRAMMNIETLHYKLSCIDTGVRQPTILAPVYGPYDLTAAVLQELIEDLYPDE